MKRGSKIALIVVLAIVVTIGVGIMSIDIWASRMASKVVRNSIASDSTTTTYMSIGKVHVLLMSGCVGVEDIYLTSDTSVIFLNDGKLQACNPKNKKPGMAVYIPYIGVDFIQYIRFLKHKELDIHDIYVYDPQIMVFLDEKKPKECLPVINLTDSLRLADISNVLKRIELANLNLERVSAELKSMRTQLHVTADSLSLAVNDLAFNMQDTTYAYNDSVYTLLAEHIYFKLGDGSAELDVRDITTKDAGSLCIGPLRFRNLVDSKKMAEKAKDYVTWVDICVNSVKTSSINPIRKGLSQDWTVDSVYADVRRLKVIRDQHMKPTHKFPLPQEILMNIPARFAIGHVAARVSEIDCAMTLDAQNYGKLNMKNMDAEMQNISNRPKNIWRNKVRGSLGGDSRLEASLDLHMVKDGTFDVKLQGENIELGALNSFLRPIAGLTCESHLDKLETSYTGDKTMASGDFLMMYHGFNITTYKENASIKEITQNAEIIQAFANGLIPKSNPTVVDAYPRRYKVDWKRDEYKPYELYVFGPAINGVIETLLPGLYVHRQIRQ